MREAILAKVTIIGCYFSTAQLPSLPRTVRNARGKVYSQFSKYFLKQNYYPLNYTQAQTFSLPSRKLTP